MAGRPPLRLGHHGKIRRIEVDKGIWIARCRYRDNDGVTRIVERQSPIPGKDQWGKQAEDELLDTLRTRKPPGVAGEVTAGSKVVDLIDTHIERLAADGKAVATIETYKAAARKLSKLIGGLSGNGAACRLAVPCQCSDDGAGRHALDLAFQGAECELDAAFFEVRAPLFGDVLRVLDAHGVDHPRVPRSMPPMKLTGVARNNIHVIPVQAA